MRTTEKNTEDSGLRAEAFDIMQNYYRTVHLPLVRCMIRFLGRLDADALKRAAQLSVSAAPQLVCRFDPADCRWKESKCESVVSILSETEENAAEKLLLSPIDFEKGPQVKLFLIRGAQNDTLCAVVSHLVVDGSGFKEYLYLLADLYSHCLADPDFQKAPEPGCRAIGQLFRGYSFREKRDVLLAKSKPIQQDASLYPPLRGDEKRSFWVRRVLKRELFSTVCSYGKDQGASANDLLLTAYVRALRDWTGQTHMEIPCPVDLRKYRKSREACGLCNLTGNYRCAVEIAADEPFAETLRKVSTQMAEQKKSIVCLKDPAMLNILFHILPRPALRGLFPKIFSVPVVSYTNIGILDDARLAFRGAQIEDAFFATAVKYAPYFQVSISTWRGECSLCSSFHGTPEDEKKVRGFLDAMKRELSEAAGC